VIIVLFLVATRQVRSVVKEAKLLSGFLVFLIIAVPWYLLVYLQNGWSFIQNFILFHHFHRFTEHIAGHSGNFTFYIWIILFGFFPWSSFLYSGIKSAIPWHWSQWKTLSKQEQFPLFCILWISIVFIFFTIAQTKLPNYIAPLFPPMAFLVASWWHTQLNSKSEIKNLKFPGIALLLLGSILATALIISPIIVKIIAENEKLAGMESFQLGFVPYLLGIQIFLGTIIVTILLWKRKYPASFVLLVVMMLLFWFFAVSELVPIVYEYQQGPLYRYATVWKEELQPNDIIIEFGHNSPSVIFYSHHPILRIGTNQLDRLNEIFQSSNRVYLISNKLKMLNQLEQIPKFQLIKIEGQYLFGKNF
jgi:hypothetical protein